MAKIIFLFAQNTLKCTVCGVPKLNIPRKVPGLHEWKRGNIHPMPAPAYTLTLSTLAKNINIIII